MDRISIQDIASVLTVKSGLKKKDAERFATTIFEVVKDGLESDRLVKIKGFGTFKVIDIEARESVNVNTGERVLIEGHSKVTFTPDTAMKELVNKPFSQFETVVLNEGVEFDGDQAIMESPETADDADSEDTAIVETPGEAVAVTMMEVVESEPSQVEDQMPEIVEQPVEEEKPETAREEFVEEKPLEQPDENPIEEQPEENSVEELPEENPIEEQPEENPIEEQPEENPIEEQPEENAVEELPEENPIEEQTEETEIEIEEGTDMETNGNTTSKTFMWVTIALLACLASFMAGYFIGLNKGKAMGYGDNLIEEIVDSTQTTPDDTAKVDSIARAQGVDAPAAKAEPSRPVETVESPVSLALESAPAPAADTKKPEAVAEPKTTPSLSGADDKYAQMDGRVRTGAYRIVGTDYEVKVKGGETTARVAKRTLGPDMECYIEVYNGLKPAAELKEGQSLKIPKLELKKKLKKK